MCEGWLTMSCDIFNGNTNKILCCYNNYWWQMEALWWTCASPVENQYNTCVQSELKRWWAWPVPNQYWEIWDIFTGISRQNPVSGWILIMRSLNWISAKSLISAQLTGFCLKMYTTHGHLIVLSSRYQPGSAYHMECHGYGHSICNIKVGLTSQSRMSH